MRFWRWLLRLLRLGDGPPLEGAPALPAAVKELVANEVSDRAKLAQVEAERAQLLRKDELLRQAVEHKEQEAKGIADAQQLQHIASDIVHRRRERDGINQQIGLLESLRTQIQTLLLAVAQVRILAAQGVSPAQIAALTTQIEQLQRVRRETEASLDGLRVTTAYAAAADTDVLREVGRLQQQSGAPPTRAVATGPARRDEDQLAGA